MDKATTPAQDAVELELHTPEQHKRFSSRIEGTTLINNTRPEGKKGRTSKKAYKDLAAARVAQARAVKRKLKEGYFPAVPGEAGLPSPFELDDSGVERGPVPRVVDLANDRRGDPPTIRDACPPQLERYQERFDFSYTDGPDGSNLWWLPAAPRRGKKGKGSSKREVLLYVGRRHFISKVEPELRGERYSDFCFDRQESYPFRPDGAALLVAHKEKLHEVDVPTGRATERYAFADREELRGYRHWTYDHGGQRVLCVRQGTVVSIDLIEGTRRPAIEVEGSEGIEGLARLADGLLAVLQPSQLSIFKGDAQGAWTRTHAMPHRKGARLGVMLGGRVLQVMSTATGSDRATVLLGVRDGALYELHTTKSRYRAGFDYRGGQWLVQAAPGGYVDWTKRRLYNLDAVWAKMTAERRPLAPDHVIDLPCLHDVIAESLSGGDLLAVRGKIRALLKRMPQTLEHRQARSDAISAPASQQTPLYYAAVRGPVELVELLLDAGADIDAVTSRGQTPLVGALMQARTEATELLLRRGASLVQPDVVEVEGEAIKTNPLIVAAARVGDQELVVQALEAGASVNARGRSADRYDDSKPERLFTPLTAALTGAGPPWCRKLPKEGVVDFLLVRGAYPNAGEDCLSPLEAAEDSPALLRRLLEFGADAAGPVGSRLLLNALGERDGHDAFPYAENAAALVAAGSTTDAPSALVRACKLKGRCAYFDAPYTDEMGQTIVAALLDGGADPSQGAPLTDAACYKQPDIAIVEALLRAGADIDGVDAKRISALRYSIGQNEDDTLANLLLDRGASVERGAGDWSPLHDAMWYGKLKVAERLLERGASVEETTSDGRSPLALAAFNDQIDSLRWLLERGASPDGGSSGFTALMAAARKGSVEGVKLLLAAGADPALTATLPWDAKDTTPRTAQEHAEAAGATATAEQLGTHTGEAFASLPKAVQADSLPDVGRLLAKGADPDSPGGDHQRRPAHLAQSSAVLEALLDAGAALDGTDKYGNTPLILAARGDRAGSKEMVALLLDRGASLEHRARGSQQTALISAAGAGALELVELLLAAGARARVKGYSPLHAAAGQGNPRIVARLLEAGAPVDAWSHDGIGKRTPLGSAAAAGEVEAARLLLAAGASSSRRDETFGDDEDENYWCYGGYTPMHYAAEGGHYELLKLLLREGDGGLYSETASHRYPEDLAEDHPRCLALIQAAIAGKTPAQFEADEAAAQTRAEQLRVSAATSDDLYLQRVAKPAVAHGDRRLPGKVELGYGDWSVLFPSGYAFCLIRSRGQYRAAVADAEGLHELPEELVQPSFHYCQSPDCARMLLAYGVRLLEIDLATRGLRELYKAKHKILSCGYAGAGLFVQNAKELAYLPYETTAGTLTQAGALPAGKALDSVHATGTDLVALVPKRNSKRLVFATLAADGLRHHARLDAASALVQLWYYQGPGDKTVRVFARDNWTDASAGFFELHNVNVSSQGALASQTLPTDPEALPGVVVVD